MGEDEKFRCQWETVEDHTSAMYTNVRYTIKVNELFTDYFKVDQGVKQG